MNNLFVETKTVKYPIHIENSFDNLKSAFETAGLLNRKVCIIADSNVEKIYGKEIEELVSSFASSVGHFSFAAGEDSKNLDVVSSFYKYFLEMRLDRKSVVIALGGGVTGDMAGFAAATFMRGISFVQIPTTLLSQVDSSVGGKVGIDFMDNKNLIGAFYQPDFVFINTSTLKTLDYLQFSSGMGEVIKHGLIQDKEYYDFLNRNKEEIKYLQDTAIQQVIIGSCKIKSVVVSQDEKETGIREILNFGHTFGHAVESLSGFKLLHGQCVALGMAAALYLSNKLGKISIDELNNAVQLMNFFELPTKAYGFNKDEVYEQMFFDKKTKDNTIHFVLLDKLACAYTDKNINKDLIMDAIASIIEK